ncbi:hypothetical protein FDI40_gp285 [Agrobacterium phage Atu_ph07]|uniref:Uncharacterized protein n=1 Tax=Agrobacterium phage Atu_ph07 TaxID=2024264 RepID=A0A2L0UZV0_9CAUD|nr:hypothetical protein FDI40_gp285 [Agrobacterium phage Atu_ph07]AUZ95057.1 hypothetical protein [Agrobacterium phage Atu_ph07]
MSPIPESKKEDSWLGIYWRPAAAIVYLAICIFDFILLPLYYTSSAPTLSDIVMSIKDLPADSQIVVLNLSLAAWEPLTLKGSGMFHLAFGAILGATAWRGLSRDRFEAYNKYEEYDTPEGDIDSRRR